MKKIFLILFTICSLQSYATIWYVSQGASGTNSGTLSNPWQSLASINMSSINAGDLVCFEKGKTYSGTLTITRSGSAGDPITWTAYGVGNNPEFIGTGTTQNYLFYMSNRSYNVFEFLKITDPTINPADSSEVSNIQRAFTFDGNSSNNIVRNCFIELAGVGVYIPSSVGGCTITNTEMTNLRMVVSSGSGDYGSNPLVLESGNNIITRNYFHDCIAQSVEFGYDGGAVELYAGGISGNVITYNRIENCLVLSEFGSGSGGTISNTVYAYNKLVNNGCTFYVNTSGGFAVAISNIQLYNNTIAEQRQNVVGDTYMIGLQTAVGTAGQIVMKNNIFYLRAGIDVCRSGQFTGSQLTHTNNLYNLGSGSVLNFTLGGTEVSSTNNIWVQQSNSNAILWDYQLLSTSLARGLGVNVGYSSDYAGRPVPTAGTVYDAGIYQYQSGQTSVTTKGLKFIASP